MDLKFIEEIVRQAHRTQFDKAGLPYFNHLLRVRDAVLDKKLHLVGHLQVPFLATALCHDLLEDTKMPMWLLEGILEPRVIAAIKLLTRDPETPYEGYIRNIAKQASSEVKDLAVTVKLADLYDNLDSHRMRLLPAETREKLCKRYYAALDVLEDR